MALDEHSTPAPPGEVVPFPLPPPPDDKNKRTSLKRGETPPANVCPIRRPLPHYEPQPVAVTMERVAIRAIFDALTDKQRRSILKKLWPPGNAEDGVQRIAAMAMLRGEEV